MEIQDLQILPNDLIAYKRFELICIFQKIFYVFTVFIHQNSLSYTFPLSKDDIVDLCLMDDFKDLCWILSIIDKENFFIHLFSFVSCFQLYVLLANGIGKFPHCVLIIEFLQRRFFIHKFLIM